MRHINSVLELLIFYFHIVLLYHNGSKLLLYNNFTHYSSSSSELGSTLKQHLIGLNNIPNIASQMHMEIRIKAVISAIVFLGYDDDMTDGSIS